MLYVNYGTALFIESFSWVYVVLWALPLLSANSLPLMMWWRRFFISNGERFNRCSDASSPVQIKERDSSVAITCKNTIGQKNDFKKMKKKKMTDSPEWLDLLSNVAFRWRAEAQYEWTWRGTQAAPEKQKVSHVESRADQDVGSNGTDLREHRSTFIITVSLMNQLTELVFRQRSCNRMLVCRRHPNSNLRQSETVSPNCIYKAVFSTSCVPPFVAKLNVKAGQKAFNLG